MILSIILGKLTPYEPQRRGNMLLSVNPGIVFISFMYIFPVVLSLKKSTLAYPLQHAAL